jgi:hypothetical protein
MGDGNAATPRDKEPTAKKQIKKPYSKPAFQFERVFETQALTCGKFGSISNQCKVNRKNS